MGLLRHKLLFSTYGTKCRAFSHERDSISGLELTVLGRSETCKQIKPNVLYEMLKERHDGRKAEDTKAGEVSKSCWRQAERKWMYSVSNLIWLVPTLVIRIPWYEFCWKIGVFKSFSSTELCYTSILFQLQYRLME